LERWLNERGEDETIRIPVRLAVDFARTSVHNASVLGNNPATSLQLNLDLTELSISLPLAVAPWVERGTVDVWLDGRLDRSTGAKLLANVGLDLPPNRDDHYPFTVHRLVGRVEQDELAMTTFVVDDR
jgi:hypothetical protein